MNETKNKLGLDNSLNISKNKYSFEISSQLPSKPLPTEHPQILLDLENPFKEQLPSNQQDAQDVLHLEDVIEEFYRETSTTQKQSTKRSSQKLPQLDLDPNKKSPAKEIPVHSENINKYKQNVLQKQEASEIYYNSDLLGSSHLSSYLQDNSPRIRDFCLQALIDSARPFSKIQLPGQTIKVQRLVINKPLIFQGTTSSILEIAESVCICITGYSYPNNKVIFSECTLKFQYLVNKDVLNQSTATKKSEEIRTSKKKSYSDQINLNLTSRNNGQITYSSNEGRIYPLFRIQANSVLEIRDSNISSQNNSPTNMSFQDICFFLEHQSHNQSNRSLEDLETQPMVFVQSSFISNFSTVIQNKMLGRIYLEKLYINNTYGHALNISNPYVLEIKECTIEQTAKSCINLRFSLELPLTFQRKVLIENCKLNEGKNYGISIFGEHLSPQACDIHIMENHITAFEKDGICIKNLNISKMRIEKNQITNNRRNGVSLQNVIDTVNFQQVRMAQNKISQSLYGLMITDVLFYSEKDEIYENTKAGILFSGPMKPLAKDEMAFYRNFPLRSILNQANIYYNKEAGLTIIGNLKGPVILNSCKVHDNTNGVYIKQLSYGFEVCENAANPRHSLIGSNTLCDPDLSHITFDKCVISQNEISGVHIKGILTKAYFKQTLIYENKNYAIFIQNENEKTHLEFQDKDQHKVREYISGYVGGSWGALFEQKYNVCKNTTCTIF